MAARTERLALSLIVILPLYDPVRLAEEMAVLDIISDGRVSYILALGYRPEEYEIFGVDFERPRPDRRREARAAAPAARRVSRSCTTAAASRSPRRRSPRAARTDVGRRKRGRGPARRPVRAGLAGATRTSTGMREAYEAACREHGHEPGRRCFPTATRPRSFVADDVDQAWEELGEYLLHDARTYAEWNPEQRDIRGYLACRDRRRAACHVARRTGSTA